jgi:hypothetical protein
MKGSCGQETVVSVFVSCQFVHKTSIVIYCYGCLRHIMIDSYQSTGHKLLIGRVFESTVC